MANPRSRARRNEPAFASAGSPIGDIGVDISYKIIRLFSEGLYSSSNKAIEELVSNSFDAGATAVHILLPDDFDADDAKIVVADNGVGMDAEGFREHWLIGISHKRDDGVRGPRGRKQIGKFGIGKLATYVLADRLTHVSCVSGRYYSTSMYYPEVPPGTAQTGRHILKLRELSKKEATDAIKRIVGSKPLDDLQLFGRGAEKSWTVAVMSDLKSMAREIRRGRLQWVLSSAMPLRDDFRLYLDRQPVEPSKIQRKKIGEWILGRDLAELPEPAPDEVEQIVVHEDGSDHVGIRTEGLGNVFGYVQIFEDPIDTGKSEVIDRSNGIFVYVHGRMINVDDAGFGIDRNLLRHGTFSRTRIVLHIDALDEELRSSREAVREGPRFNEARALARGLFNAARVALQKHEESRDTKLAAATRLDETPRSLTRLPILSVLDRRSEYPPRLLRMPDRDKMEELRSDLTAEGSDLPKIMTDIEHAEIGATEPLAVLDLQRRILSINTLHPFVAYFYDQYENRARNLPLELLAISEVMHEAHLVHENVEPDVIASVVTQRDLLLRQLARGSGRKTARIIAQQLIDAASEDHELEMALVASFQSLGFEAVPLGGKGRPDGIAYARIGMTTPNVTRAYTVTLEAKSKKDGVGRVANRGIVVSAIDRHRGEADHALICAPDFATTQGEAASLVQEIRKNTELTGKTITLIRITDLAKLVRAAPLKRLGLAELRGLFETCATPEQSASWVDEVINSSRSVPPYREIIEEIYHEQTRQAEVVDFSAVRVRLRDQHGIMLNNAEVKEECRALSRLVPGGLIEVTDTHVSVNASPEVVLLRLQEALDTYPITDVIIPEL
jgi:hypothetical protein